MTARTPPAKQNMPYPYRTPPDFTEATYPHPAAFPAATADFRPARNKSPTPAVFPAVTADFRPERNKSPTPAVFPAATADFPAAPAENPRASPDFPPKIPQNYVYLDNAATTYPKPPEVLHALNDCVQNWCGNSGRGAHYFAVKSAEAAYACRTALSELFSLGAPENVILTPSATAALNSAIFALPHRCRILVSSLEHNAVLRCVHELKLRGFAEYDVFRAHLGAEVALSDIRHLVKSDTRALIMTAASNVFPIRTPLDAVGKLCRAYGIYFIVDGAQAAGHFDINIEKHGISALAVPSHKGLYGIQGAGALLVGNTAMLENDTVFGGSGSHSKSPTMPHTLPERYEAGTLPTPALHALTAGISFVRRTGLDTIARHEEKLQKTLISRLSQIENVKIYRPDPRADGFGGCVAFNVKNIGCEELCRRLSYENICLRAGLHCAPLAHESMGTLDCGCLRASFSLFNSESDVTLLADAVENIVKHGL